MLNRLIKLFVRKCLHKKWRNIVFPCQFWFLCWTPWNPLPPLVSKPETEGFKVRARMVPETASGARTRIAWWRLRSFDCCLGFDIYNKQVWFFTFSWTILILFFYVCFWDFVDGYKNNFIRFWESVVIGLEILQVLSPNHCRN